MKKTKRILALVLSVLMVVSALPLSAFSYTTDGSTDSTATPTITLNSKGVVTSVQANGTPIVIDVDPANLLDTDETNDNNVYVWDEEGNKINDNPLSESASVYGTGTSSEGTYDNVKITLKAGTINNFAAGGTKAVIKNAQLIVDGGKVNAGLYGVMGYAASIDNYTVTINGGEINNLAGAGNRAVNVKNIVININGGTVDKLNCAMLSSNATYHSTSVNSTVVNVNGGTVNALYGGYNDSTSVNEVTATINVSDVAVVSAIAPFKGTNKAESSVTLKLPEGFDLTKITDVYDTMLYINNNRIVTEVDFGEASHTVNATYGQALGDTGLPASVTYKLTGSSTGLVKDTEWNSEYNANVPGVYTAVLKAATGFAFADFVDEKDMTFTINLSEDDTVEKHVKSVEYTDAISVDFATEIENVALPKSLSAIVDLSGSTEKQDEAYTIPFITWDDLDAYDPYIPGEYRFEANMPESHYSYDENFTIPVITVTVLRSTEPAIVDLGDYANTVMIPVNALTEFKVYDSYDVILENDNTTKVDFVSWRVTDESGEDAVIDFTTPGVYYYIPKYRSNNPLSDGLTFNIKVEITEKQIEQTTTAETGFANNPIFLHGIPVVIDSANGEDTYIYDATGLNKIYEPNVYKAFIYGGDYGTEPEIDEESGDPTGRILGTYLESTSIIMKNGNLSAIYGGSGAHLQTGVRLACYIDDVTVKMNGGTIESIYVAGSGDIATSNTMLLVNHVKRVHFEMNGGTLTTRLAVLGYHTVVTESAYAVLNGGTIAGAYTGSYSNYSSSTNTANVEIFINEGVRITTFYCAGRKSRVNKISIHISEDATITNLYMQHESMLVVGEGVHIYLDTIDQLKKFDKLTNSNSTVYFYIDGKYQAVISSLPLAETEYVVENGTNLEDIGLPTSFAIDGASISGFSWTGTYNPTQAGTYTLSLVAPSDVYLSVQIQVTVRVKVAPTNIISEITLNSPSINVDYNTPYATAVNMLDQTLSATVSGSPATIGANSFDWICEEYKPYTPGTYTFSIVLTDETYAYASGFNGVTATITVGNPTGSGTTVVALEVPVLTTIIPSNGLTANIRYGSGSSDYTVETYDIELYDTLKAKIFNDGREEEITLTGIEWAGDFDSTDDAGTYYLYKIVDFDQSAQISLNSSIIDDAAITVYRLGSVIYTNTSANFRSTGAVAVPAILISSGYEAYSSGYLGYGGMAVKDALGLNYINGNTAISKAGVYHAGGAVATRGNSSVTIDTGATATGVYAGGYLASFTGNSTVTIKDGGVVTGTIYAGSNGADFIGDSTINLEKGSLVGDVVAAGGAAFLGNVTINVASGASVNQISLGLSEANNPQSVTINVSSDFDLSKISGLESGLIRVFVDGVEHYFASKVEFGETTIEVGHNAVADYNTVLPDVYVTSGGRRFLAPKEDYTWINEDNYNCAVSGEYLFTLKFNDNYDFINNAQYNNTLTIYVKVNPDEYRQVTEIHTEMPSTKSVLYGTAADLIGLPSEIEVSSYNIKTQSASDAVTATISGVKWVCDYYNPYESHDANEDPIDYVFKMVLPDGYYSSLPMPEVTVNILKVDYPTIISLDIPVQETYFSKGVVVSPVFYDSIVAEVLDAEGNVNTVTINDVTWSCTSAYKPAVLGDYIFKINEASFDNKYLVADGVLEDSMITVHLLNAAMLNNYGQFKTNTSTVLPVYVGEWTGSGSYSAGMFDLTGCNLIYVKTGTSISSGIYGGTGYSLEATKGQTAVVYGMSGVCGKLVAGSYGTAYTGDAVIKVGGNFAANDIYAGCINNVFTGDTEIILGGDAVITNINCGSTYLTTAKTSSTSGIIVGTKEVGYNGTVTITIEDDFNGVIGSIDRGNATNVVINCPASFNYEAYVDITDPTVSVYVDGKLVESVTEIKAPATASYNVALGTEIDELVLPTTLEAVIGGTAGTITDVAWACDNYDANTPGKYVFTPVIGSNYILDGTDTSAASITVRVLSQNAGTDEIASFDPITTITVSLGAKQYEIPFPTTIKATVNGSKVDVDVDAWTCDNYNGDTENGSFVFTAVISGEYKLGAGVVAPTVTVRIGAPVIEKINVPVTETTLPRGVVQNPKFYDTLEVTLSDGRTTSISGFEWESSGYKADSLGTSVFNISKIPDGYTTVSGITMPKITVTVTSTQLDSASNVKIVYVFGIPIVVKGDVNETYIYDATGCNKIDSTNCIARTIYGGGPANTRALKTTKVVFESGKVSGIYGGSKDFAHITESTYIYAYGGTLASIYGGGNSSSTTAANLAVTENTYIYCDGVTATTRVSGGGWNDLVPGNTNITIKNSSVATVHAGTYCNAVAGRVQGTATVKLLDGAIVNVVQGAGRAATVNKSELYLSKNAVVKQSVKPTMLSAAVRGSEVSFEAGFNTDCIRSEDKKVTAYEGHFLEDRETFVRDRSVKILQNVELPIGEFYVDYGTALEDVNLPTEATCMIGGSAVTVSGFSYAPVSTYNGNISGRYAFTLTVPDGYILSAAASEACKNLSVVVDERVPGGTISAIYAEDNTEYTYANGTSFYQLKLPTAYNIKLSNGTEKSIRVTNWVVTDELGNATTYNGANAGTYVFTPEFDESYTFAKSVKKMPTWTAHISRYAPYTNIISNRNVMFLCGIPANAREVKGATNLYDKTGNFLGQISAGTIMYCGGDAADSGIETTDFTMEGGAIYGIYGATRNQNMSGSSNVTILSGTISYLRMGGAAGSLNGSNLTIVDGTITHVYGGYTDYNNGRVTMNISGGTITDIYLGSNTSGGSILGSAQEADERLSDSSIKVHGEAVETGDPIVVREGEMISGELRMTGGTVGNIFGGGGASGTISLGSVKMYIDGGSVSAVYGAGGNTSSVIYGNSYIVVGSGASVSTLVPCGAGTVFGTSYAVVPTTFNRYNILGWEETISESDDEEATTDGTGGALVVSGGMYRESCPVRFTMIGSTQVILAFGVPIKIIGEEESGEYETASDIPTYIWYLNTNEEDFKLDDDVVDWSYPTYVDTSGNPITLTGVWTRIDTALSSGSSPTIYGGGIAGSLNKYDSTYVQFDSGYVHNIYAAGKNDVMASSNVVLNGGTVNGAVYGGGHATTTTYTNSANVVVNSGSFPVIAAGGYTASTAETHVTVNGGYVGYIYGGTYSGTGTVTGEVEINVKAGTVNTIYGGGYGSASVTKGPAVITIGENAKVNGKIYPVGRGTTHNQTTSGSVNTKGYVYLPLKASTSLYNSVTYTTAQSPYVYINDLVMGKAVDANKYPYDDIAEKKVQVTTQITTGTNDYVFLNGIPTIIDGDGEGHSYLYLAATKDGSLNAYVKNAQGEIVSNIKRDPETGYAIKAAKLSEKDVVDAYIYAGGNAKSVEGTYIEVQDDGVCQFICGGDRGGNVGFDKDGNEVGRAEIRMLGGAVFSGIYVGSHLGYSITGAETEYGDTSRCVFLGIDGVAAKTVNVGGYAGVVGSEEKFLNGYYNKTGDTIEHTNPVTGEVVQVTGTWEDYNVDAGKEEYEEYYEKTNAYFNGSNDTSFLESKYYVDPDDDHYTTYCLIADAVSQATFTGTKDSNYDITLNRVYGNQYLRHSAYGMKYDAELDTFVENYNDYKGIATTTTQIFLGCQSGNSYGDIRGDFEGEWLYTAIYPVGRVTYGAVNYGQTYLNLFTEDSENTRATYNKTVSKTATNAHIRENVYPRWSSAAANALGLGLAQEAIDRGFITGVTDVKDVRTSMLSQADAATLLSYYYKGEGFWNPSNTDDADYQRVMDASDDAGNFVIRMLECRSRVDEYAARYSNSHPTKIGDCFLLTLPNKEIMLVDSGIVGCASEYLRDLDYYLASAKENGIGDGKTIHYVMLSHWHTDHYGNFATVFTRYTVNTFIAPPFDLEWSAGYTGVMSAFEAKNIINQSQGKPEIEIIQPIRDFTMTIGTGKEAVELYVMGPGNNSYSTQTFEKVKANAEKSSSGYTTEIANSTSLSVKFTYQDNTFISCGDAYRSSEVSMVRTYGTDFLNCDVLKYNHHGFTTSNSYPWLTACNPQVILQPMVFIECAQVYGSRDFAMSNFTGGYSEDLFVAGLEGISKVTMTGELVYADSQYRAKAYERNTAAYRQADEEYSKLLDKTQTLRDSLKVVANSASAAYGTKYLWKSYADYIDDELFTYGAKHRDNAMTMELFEEYTASLNELYDFIVSSTMTGGTDQSPDTTIPSNGEPNLPLWSGTTGSTGVVDPGDEDESTDSSGSRDEGILDAIGGGSAGNGTGEISGGASTGGGGGGAGPVVVPDPGPNDDDDPIVEPDTTVRGFTDVHTTDWFDTAVDFVVGRSYFDGVGNNLFAPNSNMTRAMIVTVIGRVAGTQGISADGGFTDVESSAWYADFVAWAAENKVVEGVGSGRFNPDGFVTREQLAAILYRYATFKGYSTEITSTGEYDTMKDVSSVSPYAVTAMQWAVANSVIKGSEGSLKPQGYATRAEVAQMIMNFCNTFGIEA